MIPRKFSIIPVVAALLIFLADAAVSQVASPGEPLSRREQILLKEWEEAFGPKGTPLSPEEASDRLPRIRSDLEKLISLLEACLPRRPSGYNRIWAAARGTPVGVLGVRRAPAEFLESERP